MLTDDQLKLLRPDQIDLLRRLADNRRFNQLDFWKPFQKQWDFIALGMKCAERCLFAGNQVGKSEVGAYETGCHLTGLYPKEWPGYRFHEPVMGWACGVSTTVVRDVMQQKLLGQPGVPALLGTGMLPRDHIVGKPTIARGAVADAIDMVAIKHFNEHGVQDGVSQLWFKSYEQGREKFQGPPRHFIWFDEEPPNAIYQEGLARLTATRGICMMTFTPLLALSDVVLRFTKDQGIGYDWHGAIVDGRGSIRMDFFDNPNYTQEDFDRKKAEYDHTQWDARLHGLPVLGAGRVFLTEPQVFTFDPAMEIPLHWLKLWGCDFGINEHHPFAGVLTAYDRDEDVFYVLRCFKMSDALPWMHAERFRQLGGGIPIAWPHDGHVRGKQGMGDELVVTYRRECGLPMLPGHSTWPEGGFEHERAVNDINQRIKTGRFRVAAELRDWIDEYLQYHRDEKTFALVKKRDDLLSATIKALMMRRMGKPGPIGALTTLMPHPGARPARHRIAEIDPFTGKKVIL